MLRFEKVNGGAERRCLLENKLYGRFFFPCQSA